VKGAPRSARTDLALGGQADRGSGTGARVLTAYRWRRLPGTRPVALARARAAIATGLDVEPESFEIEACFTDM